MDGVRIAQPGLDLGDAQPPRAGAAPAGQGRGGVTGVGWPAGRSSARAQAEAGCSGRPGPAGQEHVQPGQPARRHCGGAVAARRAGQHHAWRNSRPATKSCAAWPTASSGEGSPTWARIGRDSQGPGSAAGGQTVSARPPSTITSAVCSRASSRPQMKMRGCSVAGASAQRPAAADHGALQHRVQQAGQHAAAQVRQQSQRVQHRGEAIGRASPSSPAQSALGPVWSVGGGETLGGFDQRGQRGRGVDFHRRVNPQRRLEARFQRVREMRRWPLRTAPPCPPHGADCRDPATDAGRAGSAFPASARLRGSSRAAGRPRPADASAAPAAAPAPDPRPQRGPAGGGRPPAAYRPAARRRCHRRRCRNAAAPPRPARPARDPA